MLERMAPPWAPGLEHLVQAESDYQSGRQTISVHPGSAAPAGTPGVILHSYSFSSCAPPWQSLKSRAVEPKEHSEGHGTPQGKKHRSPVSNQGGSEAGPDAACDLRATCGSTACPWSFGFVIYSPGLGGGDSTHLAGGCADSLERCARRRVGAYCTNAPPARTGFIVMDRYRSEGPRQTFYLLNPTCKGNPDGKAGPAAGEQLAHRMGAQTPGWPVTRVTWAPDQ